MDLGQPVARHLIRRPHEATEVEPVPVEPAADDHVEDGQPVTSESTDR